MKTCLVELRSWYLIWNSIYSLVRSLNTHPIKDHHLSVSAKFDPHFELHPSFFENSRRYRRNRVLKKKNLTRTSTPFSDFVAHNETMTCSFDKHLDYENFMSQVRGVNLGSWMVLEPWITPSMFYQFIGKGEGDTAMDQYSFCEVLGPKEANKQLRNHWDNFVTRDIVHELRNEYHINSLRLPVGDYMYEPYGPYEGCFDGSLEYVDRLLDWAYEVNVTVLLDIHVMRGSQNGFDNSGLTLPSVWTSKFSKWPEGETQTFLHWPLRTAGWMGKFNRSTLSYPDISEENINYSLRVVQKMVDRYAKHPAVLGLEPVNEPWEFTPIKELKKYYWEAYLIVKQSAPHWKFVMHDSFRFDVKIWGGFMEGCPGRALDTHIYQAWKNPSSRISLYDNACSQKGAIAEMERSFGPVIVGEWSLATDNCVMWLNGFNDNLPGYPFLPCKMVDCDYPAYTKNQPGVPVDARYPYLGPYGTGTSGPSFGKCPVGRDWVKEHLGNNTSGIDYRTAPPEATPAKDGTNQVMTNLARKKISAFVGVGHGFYFWNFRTELNAPEWNYMLASERGWIPKGSFDTAHIRQACRREESGGYICTANRDVDEQSVRDTLVWILSTEGLDSSYVSTLQGEALYEEADIFYYSYWKKHSLQGATCDFGGTAKLERRDEQDTDDEFDDDWTDDSVIIVRGYSMTSVVWTTILGVLLGGFIGFVVAMKTSRRFNVAVRKSIFKRNKNSRMFHGSGSFFGSEEMPYIDEYDELK